MPKRPPANPYNIYCFLACLTAAFLPGRFDCHYRLYCLSVSPACLSLMYAGCRQPPAGFWLSYYGAYDTTRLRQKNMEQPMEAE
jgi:hypothetical protein